MYSWENKEQKNNIELLRLSGELKQQSEETKNLIYPGFGRCMGKWNCVTKSLVFLKRNAYVIKYA